MSASTCCISSAACHRFSVLLSVTCICICASFMAIPPPSQYSRSTSSVTPSLMLTMRLT